GVFPSRLKKPDRLSGFAAFVVLPGPGDRDIGEVFLWVTPPLEHVFSHDNWNGGHAPVSEIDKIHTDFTPKRRRKNRRVKEVKPRAGSIYANPPDDPRVFHSVPRRAPCLDQPPHIKSDAGQFTQAWSQFAQIVASDLAVPLLAECGVVVCG